MTDSDAATDDNFGAGSRTLPLGVIIPTKNSRSYLESYLTGLQTWLDLAGEVVVVDSFSSDGTVEYLRERLSHPQIKYVSHPPGLYASWNHGIAQVQSRYTFVATAGEQITREGIEHLVQTADALKCDVVISKPHFRDPAGRPLPDVIWPIDDIIATLNVTTSRKLKKLEAVVFAAVHATGALLGSSASNVFRTETLKQFPFPTDFGVAGDGAWGLMHAAEVSWGVVAERFSSFLIHPSNASDTEKKTLASARRPDDVLWTAMESWRRTETISEGDLARIHWEELMACLTSYLNTKTAFDANRRESLPWVLNPGAWNNRMTRNRSRRRLEELKIRALQSISQ